jgi:hypothetical protein
MALGGSEGSPYSSTVSVVGGTGPYRWSVPGLPPGLTASPAGGSLTISGVPTVGGAFNFTMSVSDSSSPAQTATHIFAFYVSLAPVRATVNAPGTATIGQPYSGTVTATGGDGNYTWGTPGLLPPGLTATAHGATLAISGTPVVGGVSPATGTVSDGESPAQIYNWEITITVTAAPFIINGSTPTATAGQPYTATLTASGDDGGPWTWSVASLPPGLTDTADGRTFTISGTPTTSGTYQFRVTVDDADTYEEAWQVFTIVVGPAS